MGVMACERNECKNILCRRLILQHTRYICDECWDELLLLKSSWPEDMLGSEVEPAILAFMESPKGSAVADIVGVDKEFERLTGYSEETEDY